MCRFRHPTQFSRLTKIHNVSLQTPYTTTSVSSCLLHHCSSSSLFNFLKECHSTTLTPLHCHGSAQTIPQCTHRHLSRCLDRRTEGCPLSSAFYTRPCLRKYCTTPMALWTSAFIRNRIVYTSLVSCSTHILPFSSTCV